MFSKVFRLGGGWFWGCFPRVTIYLLTGMILQVLLNGVYWSYNPLILTFDPNFHCYVSLAECSWDDPPSSIESLPVDGSQASPKKEQARLRHQRWSLI